MTWNWETCINILFYGMCAFFILVMISVLLIAINEKRNPGITFTKKQGEMFLLALAKVAAKEEIRKEKGETK